MKSYRKQLNLCSAIASAVCFPMGQPGGMRYTFHTLMMMNSRMISRLVPVLLLMFCVAIQAAHGQQPERVTFDLKTGFFEKLDLTPAKNGTLLVLLESDWAGVREVGEDYALWLGNLRREESGDSIHVMLDVELRSPSLFGRGELLASRMIETAYHRRDDWKQHGATSVVATVQTVETCLDVAATAIGFVYPAATAIGRRVIDGLELMMPAEMPQMKLEAMIVGTEVATVAHAMVKEIGR